MRMEQARSNMVEQQISTLGSFGPIGTRIAGDSPRDEYRTGDLQELAYADTCIPIGDGEVMMPPRVEGRLLQALSIQPDDLILEVGTGTGYLTSCWPRWVGT